MSDASRRELERRCGETRAPEDEALLLRERLRAGELRPGALVVAAIVGHEAARLSVLDDPSALRLIDAATRAAVEDPRGLIRRLVAQSPEAAARYAFAVARNRLAAWTAGPVLAEALDAVEAWLVRPCAEHAARARARGEHVWERLAAGDWRALPDAAREAAFTVALAAHAVSPLQRAGCSLEHLLAHERPGDRARARAEVVAWALGDDPLRPRTEETRS